MPYYIFFSYPRVHSKEPYLEKFFRDLSSAITHKKVLPPETDVCFFDQEDIGRGIEWRTAILNALQTSSVLVPIYSEHYFNSEYCGKEWQFFQMRRREYARHTRSQGLPPLIKPVLWINRLPRNLSEEIQNTQYTRGNNNNICNARGLRYVLQQINNYEFHYNEYIEDFAEEILRDAEMYQLPALAAPPALAEIKAPAPFPIRLDGYLNQAPAVEMSNHIHFIFIAADPSRFGNLRKPDPYLNRGGGEWKPYYTDNDEYPDDIYPLVQHVVSGKELKCSSDALPFDENLKQQVEKALKSGKIVILLVDSWTVNWDRETQRILQDFDTQNYLNCCVLLPWNEKDTDSISIREEIEKTIERVFRWSKMKTPIHYREAIGSKRELTIILQDIITRIRAMIRDSADPQKPVPHGPAKPIIEGPGSAQTNT